MPNRTLSGGAHFRLLTAWTSRRRSKLKVSDSERVFQETVIPTTVMAPKLMRRISEFSPIFGLVHRKRLKRCHTSDRWEGLNGCERTPWPVYIGLDDQPRLSSPLSPHHRKTFPRPLTPLWERMARDHQRLWIDVTNTTDQAQAIRTLAEILSDKEGKAFISRLDSEDAELCIEILGKVSPDLRFPYSQSQSVHQGITAEHNLRPVEKQAFFVVLRRLAERHGRLPSGMKIAGRIDVSDELLASSGSADLRSGTYMGRLVAIKSVRVTARDDFMRIRKVCINVGRLGCGHSAVPLQRFCKEVVLWSTLSHPNILKLVGVQEDMKKRQLAIVSEWMSHGNIMEFIDNYHANWLELVRGITVPPYFIIR